MGTNVAIASLAGHSTSVDDAGAKLSTVVDNELAVLRGCIQECGWTLDALSAHTGQDKSLISRMLNRERPLTLAFMCALPDDVASLYAARKAERFGHIVVAPVSREDGLKAFIAGLCAVLGASALPVKAGAPVKAELAPMAMKGIA